MAKLMDTGQARVAVLAASPQHGGHLRDLLQAAGLTVVHSCGPDGNLLQALEREAVDALLVDLHGEADAEIELIDTLLEHSSLPIMFNDSSPQGGHANALWAKRLARKLTALAAQAHAEPVTEGAAVAPRMVARPDGAAKNVWVLGASLGGPQAVRQFLAALDAELPVAFVLAQHIGANHIGLLAEQLNRVSPFKVLPAKRGHLLRHREVILAPADQQVGITEDGYLSLGAPPVEAIYSPSIDHVMRAVAERYGNRAGSIVFSGMGDDGAEGSVAIAKRGGIVWAQDVQSCIISSMPDQARKTHTVTYSANPQAMARHLYEYYRDSGAPEKLA